MVFFFTGRRTVNNQIKNFPDEIEDLGLKNWQHRTRILLNIFDDNFKTSSSSRQFCKNIQAKTETSDTFYWNSPVTFQKGDGISMGDGDGRFVFRHLQTIRTRVEIHFLHFLKPKKKSLTASSQKQLMFQNNYEAIILFVDNFHNFTYFRKNENRNNNSSEIQMRFDRVAFNSQKKMRIARCAEDNVMI